MNFLLVQPGYDRDVIQLDSELPAHLDMLRVLASDRFVNESNPGDFYTVHYDRWLIRLGRDFADEVESPDDHKPGG